MRGARRVELFHTIHLLPRGALSRVRAYRSFQQTSMMRSSFVVVVVWFFSTSKSLEVRTVWLHSTVVAETCGGVEISRLLICFQSPPFSLLPPLYHLPLSLTPLAPW